MNNFFEFFAGGGMVRAGLGANWNCCFANDIDPAKAKSYQENWGVNSITVKDIALLKVEDLNQSVDLAWASFPCQDLSLAGNIKGLGQRNAEKHTRSGTFWHFWSLMEALKKNKRAPKIIALENVVGTLSSNDGKDFSVIAESFATLGFRFGAVIIDAKTFVPQSRRRLFMIGVRKDIKIDASLSDSAPNLIWHPNTLLKAYRDLSERAKLNWIWWNLSVPSARAQNFIDVIEAEPMGVNYHTSDQTKALLGMMSPVNLMKVKAAKQARKPMIGGIYKRMRIDENGNKVQRAEVRFDEVSGCLRTASGGSSKQIVILIEGNKVRTRLLSPREGARLMGLPETYKLPEKYNDAYHLVGDGVVVPVVRYLAEHLFEPILSGQSAKEKTEPVQLASLCRI